MSRTNLLRFRRSQCGFEGRRVLVCCNEQSNSVQKVTEPTPASAKPDNKLPRPGECGVHPVDSIFGGNETIIDEYSWMVLLEYSKRKLNDSFLSTETYQFVYSQQ